MRSKEEQDLIVKRALSASDFMAAESRIVTTPMCFNCGSTMTATTDVTGKPLWVCRSCVVGDGTNNPDGITGDGASVVDQILEDDEIVAFLICSKLLESHIWFALTDDWKPDPDDTRAVYYASELPFLRTKTADQLRGIHKVKTVFGGGGRVRQ